MHLIKKSDRLKIINEANSDIAVPQVTENLIGKKEKCK